jgi:hypothetical protein
MEGAIVKPVALLAISALLVSCKPPTVGLMPDEPQLFLPQSQLQSKELQDSLPACQLKLYPSASRIHCFQIDTRTLDSALATVDPTAASKIRLLPATVNAQALFANRSMATRVSKDRPDAGYQWLGSMHSDLKPKIKIGTALLFVRGANVVGRITTETNVYEIRPLEKGVHVIIQTDLAKLPSMHPPISHLMRDRKPLLGANGPQRQSGASAPTTGEEQMPTQGSPSCTAERPSSEAPVRTVTLSVVFEAGSMPPSTNLQEVAGGYAVFTNASMANSLAAVGVSLANASAPHSIGSFVSDHQTLHSVIKGDTTTPDEIGQLHLWRTADRADIVVIITKQLDACGYAAAVKPINPAFGFVMVHPDCANAQLQVAHEIGHILGGDHENGTGTSPDSKTYARGYIMQSPNKRTIMVSSNSIAEPHYSNPAVCWNADCSERTGTIDTQNACAIGESATIVSNFTP